MCVFCAVMTRLTDNRGEMNQPSSPLIVLWLTCLSSTFCMIE